MSAFTRRIRRILGPVLAAVLCITWLAGPVLDSDLPPTTPIVETEHHPATCPPAHDHTICTQLGANQWAPSRPTFRPPDRPLLGIAPASGIASPAFAVPRTSQRSRAPPLV